MRIAVVGAGAIGGVTGAMLHRAGHDVTLVDVNEEHVEAIRADGLLIDGEGGSERVRVPATADVATIAGPIDVALLAVKSTATVPACRTLLPLLKEDSAVVSLQNGMGNEEAITEVVGEGRMLGGVVGWGATFVGPGHVARTSTEGGFEVGEWHGGRSPRADRIGAILADAAPTEVMENIRGAKWTKLIINSTINSLGALLGRRLGELVADPRSRTMMLKVITEGVRVARAEGVKLEKVGGKLDMRLLELATAEDFRALKDRSLPAKLAFLGRYRAGTVLKAAILKRMAAAHGHIKSSMWQDLERGLRTEVDVLNGYIVSRGYALGIPVPLNSMLTRLIHEIEEGERSVDARNLYLLETAEFELPAPRKLEETSRTAAFFFLNITRTFAEALGPERARSVVRETWSGFVNHYDPDPGPGTAGDPGALDRAARRWNALWFDRHPLMRPAVQAQPGQVRWTSSPCPYWVVARDLGAARDFEWPVCRLAVDAFDAGATGGPRLRVEGAACRGESACRFVLEGDDPAAETDPDGWSSPGDADRLLLASNTAGFFFAELTRLTAREIGWDAANDLLERFWTDLGTTFTKQILTMFQVRERDATAAWRTLIFLLFNRHPDMRPSMIEVLPERVVAQNLGGCRYKSMAETIGTRDDMRFPACLPLLDSLTATVGRDLRTDMVQRQCEGDGCCELHLVQLAEPGHRQGSSGRGSEARRSGPAPAVRSTSAP